MEPPDVNPAATDDLVWLRAELRASSPEYRPAKQMNHNHADQCTDEPPPVVRVQDR
jgi:hypothetical protein